MTRRITLQSASVLVYVGPQHLPFASAHGGVHVLPLTFFLDRICYN